MKFTEMWFSFRGTCSRKDYWLTGIIPLLAITPIAPVLWYLLSLLGIIDRETYYSGLTIVIVTTIVLFLWPYLAIHRKRVRDIGLPGMLLILMPLTVVTAGLRLGLLPSNKGTQIAEEERQAQVLKQREEEQEETQCKSFKEVLLRWRGRCNRRDYWIKGVIPIFIVMTSLVIIVSSAAENEILSLLDIIVSTTSVLLLLSAQRKRLRDGSSSNRIRSFYQITYIILWIIYARVSWTGDETEAAFTFLAFFAFAATATVVIGLLPSKRDNGGQLEAEPNFSSTGP